MSTQEEPEGRSKKIGLPLAPFEIVLSTVNSIRAKGGRASLDVIKTTIGKSAGTTNWATSAAASLGLVNTEGNEYTLTALGDKFAAAPEEDMKRILKEIVLRYEPYHTILLRLKNASNRSLSKSDVTKAWYDLYKSGTDSTRESYTGSFASICSYCGIIENRKKTVVLTEEGAALLEGTMPPEKTTQEMPQTTEKPLLTSDSKNEQISPISIPVAATIAINISVDTKEEDSVKNLLKIIRSLRGLDEDS